MPEKNESNVFFKDGSDYYFPPDMSGDEIRRNLEILAPKHEGYAKIQIPGFDGNMNPDDTDMVVPTVPRSYGGAGLISVGPGTPLSKKDFRARSDLVGEVVGGEVGEWASTPAAVAAAPATGGASLPAVRGAAAGTGAVVGKELSGLYQKAHGVEPNPRERAQTFGVNAVGSALLPGMMRGVGTLARKTARAGGVQAKALANSEFLKSMNIIPRLDQVLKNTGSKLDLETVYRWAGKNIASAGIIREAAETSLSNLVKKFEDTYSILRGGKYIVPRKDIAGSAFRRGVDKFKDNWIEVGGKLYDDFFKRLPKDTNVSWENSRKMLENVASLEDEFKSLTPAKLRGVHKDLMAVYSEVFPGRAYPGSRTSAPMTITRGMPYDKMKRLRTRVGELIGTFEPDADLPKAELKKLYGALTDDMREAARKHGALAEFDAADNYWKANIKVQKDVLERIYKKHSSAEIGNAINTFVNDGRIQELGVIKATFGKNSQEWNKIKNYSMVQLGTDNAGNFDINKLYKSLQGESKEPLRRVLAGVDTSERRALDKYLKAVDLFGPEFSKRSDTLMSRFTQAETLGPLAAAGALGFGTGMYTGDKSKGMNVALIGVALGFMAPRKIAKMITDEKFVDWAVGGGKMTPHNLASHIGRLSAIYADSTPDEQAAVMEFMGAMNTVLTGSQSQPMQQKGLIAGGR